MIAAGTEAAGSVAARGALSRRGFLAIPFVAAMWRPLGGMFTRGGDLLVASYARLDTKTGLRVPNLGCAYLDRNSGEASRVLLTELIGIFHGESLRPALQQGELAMHAALNEVYHPDFEAERVVRVDGWVLSLTEARLHAWRCLGLPDVRPGALDHAVQSAGLLDRGGPR